MSEEGFYVCSNCASIRKFDGDMDTLYFDCGGCGNRSPHNRLEVARVPAWDKWGHIHNQVKKLKRRADGG